MHPVKELAAEYVALRTEHQRLSSKYRSLKAVYEGLNAKHLELGAKCEDLQAENKDLRTKNREVYLQYSYALDKVDALRAELEQAKLYKTMYHELVSSVLRAKS